jgi:hypothetical protein
MSDSTPDDHQVDVNLSRIRQIAETGVNRASLFMGLALNAADREDVTDCSLHSQSPMAPKTGRPADMKRFRSEFKRWIVHCGFRELIEAFNLFLDRIYEACCVMALSKTRMTSQEMRKRINSVKDKGLPGKHRELIEQFGVSTRYIDDLKSVSKARNCLAHNIGVVTDRDVGDDGNLVLTWHGAVDWVVRDVHSIATSLGSTQRKPSHWRAQAITWNPLNVERSTQQGRCLICQRKTWENYARARVWLQGRSSQRFMNTRRASGST